MSNRGVGRLLVIVVEGINLTACDANGKMEKYSMLLHLCISGATLLSSSSCSPSWKWFPTDFKFLISSPWNVVEFYFTMWDRFQVAFLVFLPGLLHLLHTCANWLLTA